MREGGRKGGRGERGREREREGGSKVVYRDPSLSVSAVKIEVEHCRRNFKRSTSWPS